MTARKPTLNNMSIQVHRRNALYQAVITDLCLEGIIPRSTAEGILGYEIPAGMKSPTGKTAATAAAAAAGEQEAKKPLAKKKE